MAHHIVIDGNAFYEVDDDCMNSKKLEIMKKEIVSKPSDIVTGNRSTDIKQEESKNK